MGGGHVIIYLNIISCRVIKQRDNFHHDIGNWCTYKSKSWTISSSSSSLISTLILCTSHCCANFLFHTLFIWALIKLILLALYWLFPCYRKSNDFTLKMLRHVENNWKLNAFLLLNSRFMQRHVLRLQKKTCTKYPISLKQCRWPFVAHATPSLDSTA